LAKSGEWAQVIFGQNLNGIARNVQHNQFAQLAWLISGTGKENAKPGRMEPIVGQIKHLQAKEGRKCQIAFTLSRISCHLQFCQLTKSIPGHFL
jgi:hypothetical protein